MVTAGDQLGAILQDDAESRLAGGPVRQHAGAVIASVVSLSLGPVDLVTGRQVREGTRGAVGHQDGGTAVNAVGAAVLAAPVGIQAEAEAHVGAVVLGQDGLRRVHEEPRGLAVAEVLVVRFEGVGLEVQRLEAVGRVVGCGAAAERGGRGGRFGRGLRVEVQLGRGGPAALRILRGGVQQHVGSQPALRAAAASLSGSGAGPSRARPSATARAPSSR